MLASGKLPPDALPGDLAGQVRRKVDSNALSWVECNLFDTPCRNVSLDWNSLVAIVKEDA